MILSASRRTDIPAYYSQWFLRRMEAGFVCVRNPVNYRQVSRIPLSPEVVDGIVFWTKNPIPMLESLHLLKDYPYYFQFTLTSYGKDLEPGIPGKKEQIIPAFRELSRKIGSERVIWRYDPILLTPKYTVEYHVRSFEELSKRLSGFTEKCVISFVDLYRHLGRQFQPMETAEIYELAGRFSDIASKYHMTLETCTEGLDLSQFDIRHGHCVDGMLFEKLIGQPLSLSRDKNQREACGCVSSIDIGMYNSCANSCKYCYANHSPEAVRRNIQSHNPDSALLYGNLTPEDIVKDRAVISCKEQQLTLFSRHIQWKNP